MEFEAIISDIRIRNCAVSWPGPGCGCCKARSDLRYGVRRVERRVSRVLQTL